MEVVKGKILELKEDGAIIFAPIPSIERAIKREYETVEVGYPDGRFITLDQRRKAYALMRYVEDYTGDDAESNKQMLKMAFLRDNVASLYKSIFSLSNCDRTTAREFITWLINFIITNEIPTDQPLYTLSEDIEKYVYTCLLNKKCAVCGRHAELHHIDAIGMGNNRHTINQMGMEVISLCRLHHSESHQKGQERFLTEYHLKGIKLNKQIGKVYNLTKKNLGE